jgi:uncharacterized protein YjbI with pentapeptide repeats
VWQRVRVGEVADFNKRERLEADPTESRGWTESRKLRSAFFETLLLSTPYSSTLPRQGVRIEGARFETPVELENAEVKHQLRLERCRFDSQLELSRLRSTQLVSFEGSAFYGDVDLKFTTLGTLSFKGAKLLTVDFEGATIEGDIDVSNARCDGDLNMKFVTVGKSLDMREGEFAHVNLVDAKIRNTLWLDNVHCNSDLKMWGISIDHDLFMRSKNGKEARFTTVDLLDAEVKGVFLLYGTRFTGELKMHGLRLNKYMDMREAQLAKRVDLGFAKFNGGLLISGAHFSNELDLSAANIRGELNLGSGSKKVVAKRLKLTNTSVNTVQCPDNVEAWPALELNGFTYSRLGRKVPGINRPMDQHSYQWFKSWLEKDAAHSRQPYEQAAAVLEAMGHPTKADKLRYAGKEQDRKGSLPEHPARWAWLGLLKITIGYGYGLKYFWSLGWVAVFALTGMFVIKNANIETIGATHAQPSSKASCTAIKGQTVDPALVRGQLQNCPLDQLAFSIETLVPIIRFDDKYKNVVVTGWGARGYFYFQEIVGALLASFVIAGLSGITKK